MLTNCRQEPGRERTFVGSVRCVRVEGFLCEHDIPFHSHAATSLTHVCRPGMDRPLDVPSNGTGDDLMDVKHECRVAKELARLAVGKPTKDKLWRRSRRQAGN